ncbi:hypothetical protein PUR61_13515, partial [Streptomyces sp. BE20]|uniref:hypothetical protein n=1 Tax=Streptomyces sp. BE20 TaxID=3002525 RepID=UPI002E774738
MSEIAELTQPDRVEWCDGSAEEYQRLADLLVAQGTFKKLTQRRPPPARPQRQPHVVQHVPVDLPGLHTQRPRPAAFDLPGHGHLS